MGRKNNGKPEHLFNGWSKTESILLTCEAKIILRYLVHVAELGLGHTRFNRLQLFVIDKKIN
jgi:hypothetical protein